MKALFLLCGFFILLNISSCSGGTDYKNRIIDQMDWYFQDDEIYLVLEKKRSRLNNQMTEVFASKSVITLSASFEHIISINSIKEDKVKLVQYNEVYGLDLQSKTWVKKDEIVSKKCDNPFSFTAPIAHGMMALFCHLDVNIIDINSNEIIKKIDISLIRPWLKNDWKDDMYGDLSNWYDLRFLSNDKLVVFPYISNRRNNRFIYIDIPTGKSEILDFDIPLGFSILDVKLVDGKLSLLASAEANKDGEEPVYIIDSNKNLTKIFDDREGRYLWVPEKKLVFQKSGRFETRPDVIKMSVVKYDYDKNIRINGMLILPNTDPTTSTEFLHKTP